MEIFASDTIPAPTGQLYDGIATVNGLVPVEEGRYALKCCVSATVQSFNQGNELPQSSDL